MSTRDQLGGIIHTYQKYDPTQFPSPTTPPPSTDELAYIRKADPEGFWTRGESPASPFRTMTAG